MEYETNNGRDRRQMRAAGVPAPTAARLQKIEGELATLRRNVRARHAGGNASCLWCGGRAVHHVGGDHDLSGDWCRKCLVELMACRLGPTASEAKHGGPDAIRSWPGRVRRAGLMLDSARLASSDDDDGPQAA